MFHDNKHESAYPTCFQWAKWIAAHYDLKAQFKSWPGGQTSYGREHLTGSIQAGREDNIITILSLQYTDLDSTHIALAARLANAAIFHRLAPLVHNSNPREAVASAVQSGNVAFVRHLASNSWPFRDHLFAAAAEASDIPMLNTLLELGVQLNVYGIVAAIKRDDIPIVQWFVDNVEAPSLTNMMDKYRVYPRSMEMQHLLIDAEVWTPKVKDLARAIEDHDVATIHRLLDFPAIRDAMAGLHIQLYSLTRPHEDDKWTEEELAFILSSPIVIDWPLDDWYEWRDSHWSGEPALRKWAFEHMHPNGNAFMHLVRTEAIDLMTHVYDVLKWPKYEGVCVMAGRQAEMSKSSAILKWLADRDYAAL